MKFSTVNISFYSSRTLEERLERYFESNGGRKRWTDVLQSINESINATVNSSIDMAPDQVNKGNARELFDYLKQKMNSQRRKSKTKFEVGDLVRIPYKATKLNRNMTFAKVVFL